MIEDLQYFVLFVFNVFPPHIVYVIQSNTNPDLQ